jgi:SAM-dependent methyltransferase
MEQARLSTERGATNLRDYWRSRDYEGIASYTTGREAEWFQHLGHLALRKAVTARLRRLAAKPRFDRVVDLGCATGDWTFEYAEFSEEVVGVDINASFIREAERRLAQSPVRDRVGFATTNLVEFKDYEGADLVCFGACLTLIDDDEIEGIFNRIAGTVAPGALVYVRVGVSCLRRKTYRTARGNYRRRAWYESCFARHGLAILDATSSAAAVAGELAREGARGNARLGDAVGTVVHGLFCAHHAVNGRNDHMNWILRI